MHVERERLRERRARATDAETLGFVEEAPYLGRAQPSWFEGLFGAVPRVALKPPFGARGEDVLGVFDERAEVLDGDDDPFGSIRRASGRVVCLAPRERGDEVVLRDLWLEDVRVLDSIHFALETDGRAPIAIAFAQMPLVIGVPRADALDTFLGASSHPASTSVLRDTGEPAARSGLCVELREGDHIEVLGQAWDPDRCDRRFDLEGRTTSYRERQQPIQLVLGDAPGLRMVIRSAPR